MLNFKNIKKLFSPDFLSGNKPFYILFSLFFSLSFGEGWGEAHAQTNLIYNGDFELYDTCPVSVSTPSSYQLNTCIGWYSPTYATSDYYNTCAPWPVSVPTNAFGTRSPYSGNAYCGTYNEYCYNPGICNYGWWIEYVQSALIQPLKADYEYTFTVHVAFTNNLGYQYAYSSFGAHFSENSINRIDAKPFSNLPQVRNNPSNYLTDTNWVEIKGNFVAQGGEKFVTIGFFVDTTNLDTLLRPENTDPVAYWNFGSYYFIDNCSLLEIGPFEQPNIFTPNGDGVNDIWKPKNRSDEDIVKIYDRWGLLVYELTAKEQSWDGRTSSGTECVTGVYYFVIINNNRKETNTQKGFIQLVR